MYIHSFSSLVKTSLHVYTQLQFLLNTSLHVATQLQFLHMCLRNSQVWCRNVPLPMISKYTCIINKFIADSKTLQVHDAGIC